MSSITIGGKNLKYSNLSKEQIERILTSANEEIIRSLSKDNDDKFLQFLRSKEFSSLYKEVHDVISKEIEVKLQFSCVYIEISYSIDPWRRDCINDIICKVKKYEIDNKFYSQFNNFQFLKNIMYDEVSLYPSSDNGSRIGMYFMGISSYRGKNKELLKAKNAFNKMLKEFKVITKKVKLFEDKFKLKNNVGNYTSLFHTIIKSKTLEEARIKLISY